MRLHEASALPPAHVSPPPGRASPLLPQAGGVPPPLPWACVLMPKQLRRGLSYYGSGARIERLAARLLSGEAITAVTIGTGAAPCLPCRHAALHLAFPYQTLRCTLLALTLLALLEAARLSPPALVAFRRQCDSWPRRLRRGRHILRRPLFPVLERNLPTQVLAQGVCLHPASEGAGRSAAAPRQCTRGEAGWMCGVRRQRPRQPRQRPPPPPASAAQPCTLLMLSCTSQLHDLTLPARCAVDSQGPSTFEQGDQCHHQRDFRCLHGEHPAAGLRLLRGVPAAAAAGAWRWESRACWRGRALVLAVVAL